MIQRDSGASDQRAWPNAGQKKKASPAKCERSMNRRKNSLRRLIAPQIILVALLASARVVNAVSSQTGQSPSKVTLSDLRFIAGLWQSDWNGGLGEERWSAPSGDSMMGTFRFVKDGKGRFYELMLIEQTPDGLVLKLKHFNAGLIGWEDKAEVYSFHLVDYGRSFVVFELENKSSRLTYRASSRDALSVLLEHPTDAKQKAEEFKFKRVK